MENLTDFKQEIIEIGKCLYNKSYTPGTSGNISIRHNNKVLITPSGMSLGDMELADIIVINYEEYIKDLCSETASDFEKYITEGRYKPSSEKIMHLEIYRRREDITAIIHAHAAKPTAFAAAGIPLDAPILSEAMFVLGEVPVAEYAMPSSDKLASIVAGYFENHDTVLLANHGVVLGGRKLKDTYYKLETLDLYAEVSLWTRLLGNANKLSSEDIEDLTELRKKMS